jgi:hypothetical protein
MDDDLDQAIGNLLHNHTPFEIAHALQRVLKAYFDELTGEDEELDDLDDQRSDWFNGAIDLEHALLTSPYLKRLTRIPRPTK